MVVGAETVNLYRAEAARLRDVAKRALHAEIRVELLAIAAQFEKLAQFAEAKVDPARHSRRG